MKKYTLTLVTLLLAACIGCSRDNNPLDPMAEQQAKEIVTFDKVDYDVPDDKPSSSSPWYRVRHLFDGDTKAMPAAVNIGIDDDGLQQAARDTTWSDIKAMFSEPVDDNGDKPDDGGN